MSNLIKFRPNRDRIPMIEFSKSHAEEIIDGMSNGELLTELCSASSMPLPQNVRRWAIENAEFGAEFSKAMEMQAHMLFEEGVLVARNAGNKDNQTRNKNHMEACFRAAGKLLPKVYGDKSDVTTIIPIQIITNLGDGKDPIGVGHGVYKIEIPEEHDS